ncbi:TPA: hypothetical protein ACU967_005954 [Burkholderia contaminans]|uniref:hypothetical protein n=1 Tax=Burkholderia cepacia complex TaxID=87882 RepID=UPI0009C0157C|nr:MULTISPECIES: hypothetical protein [Burkholderia cepacia complex]MBM6430569.1 hypothetical protein [Burkholderia contaminans]MCA7880848.1 hypothetical protein [Burkholderia contaminans]MCB4349248.1 hypothetical protein [Burkholderia vietnamiensis]MDN8025828.1 hypothetical protein [Burkholderia contaminans]PRG04173.1 hypothetical protein C6Q17_28465 [Burkholderia contaminans]
MRLIFAALLGAAATLPALVHATTTIPDPTDAAASVPATTVPSAFEGYHPYRDGDGPTWQQLNRAVLDKPTKGGVKHETTPNKPADKNNPQHSMHGEAAK